MRFLVPEIGSGVMTKTEVHEFVLAETWRQTVVDGIPRLVERMNDISHFPEAASAALDNRLAPYGLNALKASLRLDNDIRHGRIKAPWAILVLDREYRFAGHVVGERGSANVPFAPFAGVPTPMPPDFVPGVGMIFVSEQQLLHDLAQGTSRLFQLAWAAMNRCDPRRHWLCCLEPLPHHWVTEVEANDTALFRSLRKRN